MRNISELNINDGGKRIARSAPFDEVINAFQSHFGIILPKSYLRLLQHSNGGHPELDSIVPVSRPGAARWAVNRFHYLDTDKTSAGSLWAAAEKWKNILGEGCLPFAADGGGNQFFLDFKISPPPVKICVHDENFSIVDVAPTFESFIDGLTVDPDMI
ncbi:MAG: SMI1/KNR4 family protein [Verrucomicrobiia bacterium]|jgi:hypothetical protein